MIACRSKHTHGKQFCVSDCPTAEPGSPFRFARVEAPADVPPADARTVEVAILDMNHGWSNLGHDSLVHAVAEATCDVSPALRDAGLCVRVLSYEVRRRRMLPDSPGERCSIYLGTGGPGEIDPHRNDGLSLGSQGLVEDPAWEAPLFRLFDRIQGDADAAMLSVCHTFGVMCRWSGVAEPSLRAAAKGGKSAGIVENVLTPEALAHPWFRHFADELPPGARLRVVDHRLFDLIPAAAFPAGHLPVGYETRGVGGPAGEALTMMEFARDRGGVMPRVFGVNHHPEIVDRARQLMLLRQKYDRGEVDAAWFDDRRRVLTETYPDDSHDQRLHLTSSFTLLAPLRYHLYRQLRLRAERLGIRLDVSEDVVAAAHAAADKSVV